MSDYKPIRIKRKNSNDEPAAVRIKRRTPPATPPPELESDEEEYDTQPINPEYYPSESEHSEHSEHSEEKEDDSSPFISEEELSSTNATIELVLKVGNSYLRLGMGSLDNEQTRQIVATLLGSPIKVESDEGNRFLTTTLKVVCLAFILYLIGQIGN